MTVLSDDPPNGPLTDELRDEIENFAALADMLRPSPGRVPEIPGIDIYGVSMPLRGAIGGDHTIYIDFNRRYDLDRRIREADQAGLTEVAEALATHRERAGVLLADVSGHRVTDGLLAAMLHQAFLLGAYYELDRFGRITTKLFEHINQRFYRTTGIHKYLTMLYGEITSRGTFHFISAGHPYPMVFSRQLGKFACVSKERLVTYPPVGMFASNADADEHVDPGQLGYKQRYTVNEIELLGEGDLVLLYTDGLSEHAGGEFFSDALEDILAKCHGCTAQMIAETIQRELTAFAVPEDDISYVVIQRAAKSLPSRDAAPVSS